MPIYGFTVNAWIAGSLVLGACIWYGAISLVIYVHHAILAGVR